MKVSKCTLPNQICGDNNTKKLCPPGWNRYYQFIRPCYCPTSYFNQYRPDPHTYLQYWRRRMCYMNYLQYYGVLDSNLTQYPSNMKYPMFRRCPSTFYNNGSGQLPYLSGAAGGKSHGMANLCKQ